MKHIIIMLSATLLVAGSYAESITHGGTTINMEFVDIGYAGNAGDNGNLVNGIKPGSVAYDYRIGKFEVTASEWASVIAADSSVGNAGFTSGLKPTRGTTWLEAAKFANWLTSGSYNNGAYQFSDPSTLTGVDRNSAISTYDTVYVLPTEDEWYKAAYFKSDGSGYTLYATGNSAPVAGTEANWNYVLTGSWDVGSGIAENNGTYDMTGNMHEQIESALDGTLDDMGEQRVSRGGSFGSINEGIRSWDRYNQYPTTGDLGGDSFGFRVAAIPEPSSIAMIGLVSGSALFIRRIFVV